MQKPKVINYQERAAIILSKQREMKNAEEREKQLAAIKVEELKKV